MCSPRVFPIAPRCNPIRFAQSPPLLTYIGGPKGEALHLSFGGASVVSTIFFFFLRSANQIGSLQKKIKIKNKNKIELVRQVPTN
jgi:hypothetical protein